MDAENKNNRRVILCSILTMVLSLVMSFLAIRGDDQGAPHILVWHDGVQEVELYGGQGIYQNDSLLKAITMRGFDWAVPLVQLPLMILGILLYQRRRRTGLFLLLGCHFYFFYCFFIGAALGMKYNYNFLLYLGISISSLIALISLLFTPWKEAFSEELYRATYHRALSLFLVFLAGYFTVMWVGIDLKYLLHAVPPEDNLIYTAPEFNAADLGLYVPLSVFGALSLWKKREVGLKIAFTLLIGACQVFCSMTIAGLIAKNQYQRPELLDLGEVIVLTSVIGAMALYLLIRASRSVKRPMAQIIER